MNVIEEEMASRSSVLAWRIPWTEESGGLQSMGSQRVRHDCRALARMRKCDKLLLLWSKRGHHLLNCLWRGSPEALNQGWREDRTHPRQGCLRSGGSQRSPTATSGSSQNRRPQGRRKPEEHALCPQTLCQQRSVSVRPLPTKKKGEAQEVPTLPQKRQN